MYSLINFIIKSGPNILSWKKKISTPFYLLTTLFYAI